MTPKRLILLTFALTLAACSVQEEEFVIVADDAVTAEEPSIERNDEVCPQSGDGIGGTGCPQTTP